MGAARPLVECQPCHVVVCLGILLPPPGLPSPTTTSGGHAEPMQRTHVRCAVYVLLCGPAQAAGAAPGSKVRACGTLSRVLWRVQSAAQSAVPQCPRIWLPPRGCAVSGVSCLADCSGHGADVLQACSSGRRREGNHIDKAFQMDRAGATLEACWALSTWSVPSPPQNNNSILLACSMQSHALSAGRVTIMSQGTARQRRRMLSHTHTHSTKIVRLWALHTYTLPHCKGDAELSGLQNLHASRKPDQARLRAYPSRRSHRQAKPHALPATPCHSAPLAMATGLPNVPAPALFLRLNQAGTSAARRFRIRLKGATTKRGTPAVDQGTPEEQASKRASSIGSVMRLEVMQVISALAPLERAAQVLGLAKGPPAALLLQNYAALLQHRRRHRLAVLHPSIPVGMLLPGSIYLL